MRIFAALLAFLIIAALVLSVVLPLAVGSGNSGG